MQKIQGNGRIRRWLMNAALGVVGTAMMMGMILAMLNAAEKEAEWRAERLCRIYHHCPK